MAKELSPHEIVYLERFTADFNKGRDPRILYQEKSIARQEKKIYSKIWIDAQNLPETLEKN